MSANDYDRFAKAARNRDALKKKARKPADATREAFPGETPASRDGAPDTSKRVEQRADFLRLHGVAPNDVEKLARDWIRPRGEGPRKSAPKRARLPPSIDTLDPAVRIPLERVIGLDDTLPIAFLLRAAKVAKAVGRVGSVNSAGGFIPDGTGFLIGEGMLMTNEHVLPDAGTAAARAVEFDFEEDEDGNGRATQRFLLDPGRLFLVSKDLDVAVVAVRATSAAGTRIAEFGAIPVRDQTERLADGVGVVLIQHPRGEPKRIALRENEVDYLDETWVHYQADTDPGSSGSPVLDMNLELVALHHSGVPDTNEKGEILATDGSVWDRVDPRRVRWVANEGIRIERICAWMQQQRKVLDAAAGPLLDAVLANTRLLPSHLGTAGPRPMRRPASVPLSKDRASEAGTSATARAPTPVDTTAAPSMEMRWVIPIEVTVRVLATQPATADARPAAPAAPAAPAPIEEALRFDKDYTNRAGYDPDWLDGVSIPLPTLSAAQRDLTSRDRTRAGEPDDHVLRYHHFSVIHHRVRRLPWFTAVNTTRDPALRGRLSRKQLGKDRWIRDPRILPADQVTDDELYAGTPFDLGHLVMRLDAYWGDDEDFAQRANADTFHYTNCTPQHSGFNQEGDGGIWGALETHIGAELKSAVAALSIFAGPVFVDDDRAFRGVPIPRSFWKIVAGLDDAGDLAAFGFVLSQDELLRGMEFEGFSPGEFVTWQVPIAEIERRTGLTLPDVLRDADQGPETDERLERFRPLKRRPR